MIIIINIYIYISYKPYNVGKTIIIHHLWLGMVTMAHLSTWYLHFRVLKWPGVLGEGICHRHFAHRVGGRSCGGFEWDFHGKIPSGKHRKRYWKWPTSSLIYPLNMMMFHSFLYVNQRVQQKLHRVHGVSGENHQEHHGKYIKGGLGGKSSILNLSASMVWLILPIWEIHYDWGIDWGTKPNDCGFQ